ncbi:alpha/beta fold hydrolase [Metabacillus halosaccharovorans]|uniref:alpha/beta fold hydrolase n=1 Tax=Metabacillus halosaccharovorans TaxID=930124 RepID=UPI001C1F8204|nr:alpha/beta hydrolase [Metabacillus halosaccharovorans]MBU7595360.1 alpha/beta hydrolase [Metabacillus halosaccharovorans]MCM3439946.1 alpha/beta hydrolase [Metabacillus halosaccharovorans]
MKNENWLTMSDEHQVYVCQWEEKSVKPRAVVQVAHGMAEHIKRYEPLAMFLNSKGIIVIGHDHRGHGQTGEKGGQYGFFAESNGFERTVDDMKEVYDFIKNQYPELPVFLMGHSMGSFLVRRFLQRFQVSLYGVILSGTGGNPGYILKVAKKLAETQVKKWGNRAESPFLQKLTTGSYNKKFTNANTGYEWLTRDSEQVSTYINDPYCGKVGTTGFFQDLYYGLDMIHRNEEVSKIDRNLPFYLFSGDMDPVGNYTKGVNKLINQLRKHGIKQIDYKFYENGRHEMLNEVNREVVYEDIYRWIEKNLN